MRFHSGRCISFFVLASLSMLTSSINAQGMPEEEILKYTRNTAIFKATYEFLKSNSLLQSHDCKFKSSKPEKDSIDEKERLFWGTSDTLRYLAEETPESDLTLAEKRMNRAKLRFFLARLGYLQNPGSLVFVDKQTLTLRLTGCRKDSVWRHHGSQDDAKLQNAHYVGATYRNHAPNPHSYIQKYTCFNKGDNPCSHTFYVIIKLVPDMPLGLQVREEHEVKDMKWYCGVPYCSMQKCKGANGKEALTRSFPPYRISWQLPHKLEATDELVTGKTDGNELLPKMTKSYKSLMVTWSWKVKDSKDAMKFNKDGDSIDAIWENAFGEKINIKNPALVMYPVDNDVGPSLLSEITIKNAMAVTHSGLYECVIEDGNGVVTTPNVALKDRKFDYMGDANLHVMPKWQLFIPVAVALGCIVLVALIIAICPKKMEYDDGTPYTKDELVCPAIAPTPATTDDPNPCQKGGKTTKKD